VRASERSYLRALVAVAGLTWITLVPTAPARAAEPVGSISTFSDATIASPQGIVAGPDGNLWFTNSRLSCSACGTRGTKAEDADNMTETRWCWRDAAVVPL
jgi:hypothetical protein